MVRIMPPIRNTRHGTPGFICGGAFVFGLNALYLLICYCGCYSQDGREFLRRETFSLLLAVLLTACGANPAGKPDLPQSVSPGWTLASFGDSAAPQEIPGGNPPQCWKAQYTGPGTADVWVCGYKVEGGAFDAVQRARAEAQTVKFQEGRYLVLVKWNAAPKVSLTALIRAVQKTLNPK
jgi:hypothetical protein